LGELGSEAGWHVTDLDRSKLVPASRIGKELKNYSTERVKTKQASIEFFKITKYFTKVQPVL